MAEKTAEAEALTPGVSVEELDAQQKAFDEYLSGEKPERQQQLFKVDSTLAKLQSSQRNNGAYVWMYVCL